MPNGRITEDELMDTLNFMHDNKMYKEMVMYIEACYSGSMFANFKTDLDIYAITAANAKESSWGTYCPPDDDINGVHLHTCLGDLFSVNWMQDSDDVDPDTQTLQQQFVKVQKETTKSHVL